MKPSPPSSVARSPMHSNLAGDLASDRRVDDRLVRRQLDTLAPAYRPTPLVAVSPGAPTPDQRDIERFVAEFGASKTANNFARFPKAYLATQYSTQVGQATDQKHSGRCWIFANLNVLRTSVLPRYGSTFAYSQNYVAYWDKVERANAFLEKMIELSPLAADNQRVLNLIENFYADGGDWEFFRNIVEKYGVVPTHAMPETNFSGNSKGYMALLETRLREVGGLLHQMARRGASAEKMQALKDDTLAEVRTVLNRYLGRPPENFVWKDPKTGRISHLTPLQFYKDGGHNLGGMVHLTNLPYLPMNTRVQVEDVNNVVGARGMEALNIGLDEIKAAARRSIIDGVPVMFAAETCESDADMGLFALGSTDTERVAGLGRLPRMAKGDRLKYRVTKLAHAMSLTGCDSPKANGYAGTPPEGPEAELTGPLWKLENSWKGRDSMFMTDAWFDTYVYAIVVDPKYLSDDVRALAADKFTATRRVDAWDPLGRV